MFSPVFWLLYFFDKKEWWWEWVTKNFSLKEFINLALVPVYVSAALSFGLIFIFIVSDWMTWAGNWNSTLGLSDSWVTINIWVLKYSINGSILSSAKEWTESLMWKLKWWSGTLIMSLMWIAILWMSVMAALKSSTITWNIVEPIAWFWKSIWELAMKSPQYAPIFWGMSANGLWQAGTMVKQHYSNKSIKTGTDWVNKNTHFWSDPTSKMSIINSKYDKSVLGDIEQVRKYHWEMAWEIKDLNATLANSSTREKLFEMIKKIYWDAAYNAIKGTTNETDFANKFRGVTLDNTATTWWKSYFTNNIVGKGKDEIIKLFEWWKVVKEWDFWGVDPKIVKLLKSWSWIVEFNWVTWDWKGKQIENGKVENIDTNINLAVSERPDWQGRIYMATTIHGNSAQMTFDNSKAFNSTTLSDISSNIIEDDKIALIKILNRMSENNQVEFLKKMFPKASSDIDKVTLGEFRKSKK